MAACRFPVTQGRAAPGSAGGKKRYYTDMPALVRRCGKCLGCRMSAAQDWATRIVHESKLHEENSFLTLTYSDTSLPEDRGLSKREFQLFMKRLRKDLDPKLVRFFGCGEYGDRTNRPHYHLILFGHAFYEDRKHWKNSRTGEPLYVSRALDSIWGLGQCWIGNVTHASAGYVARYTLKKSIEFRMDELERIDPNTGCVYRVEEEFILMSRRPGLGSGWWDQYKSDAFPKDFVIINGARKPVPNYYRNKWNAEPPPPGQPTALKNSWAVDHKRRLRALEGRFQAENTTERRMVKDEIDHKRASEWKREPE